MLGMGQPPPCYRTSNGLKHHSFAIAETATCGCVEIRSLRPYFWLSWNGHQMPNIVQPSLDLLITDQRKSNTEH